MKEIKLTQGYVALVDDEDYPMLIRYNWHVNLNHISRTVRCACTNIWDKETKTNTHITMHVMIMGRGMVVDHVDGNPINNQRVNLRKCTQSQNVKNRSIQKGNKSGFKGVFFQKELGRWRAQISLKNKPKHLGCFDNKIEAAMAYNEAAIRYYGEFAKLNKLPCAVG